MRFIKVSVETETSKFMVQFDSAMVYHSVLRPEAVVIQAITPLLVKLLNKEKIK